MRSLQAGNFAGHSDWRLPTFTELQTIVDPGAPGCGSGSPCVPPAFNSMCTGTCTVTTCSCTVPNEYWSATTEANLTNLARVVNFNSGGTTGASNKVGIRYVRAVRGGS